MATATKKDPSLIRRGYDPRDEKTGGGEGAGWLSIADGEAVEVTLLYNKEDIIRYEQIGIWTTTGKAPPTWPYSGDDDPMHELGLDPKNTKRYRAVLPVLTDEGEVKVWGMSKRVHTQLLDIADDSGSLKGLTIRIRRTGTKLSTNYTLTVRGKRKDVSHVAEPDILGMIGPLTAEEVREMLAKRFGKESYEEFLDAYRGKSSKAGGKAKLKEDDDEDPEASARDEDDDTLDLDDLELK